MNTRAERIGKQDGDSAFLECPQCSYSSYFEYQLKRHIQAVHEGLKPYICSYCEYQSSYKQHLRLHCQRVHQVELKSNEIPSHKGSIKYELGKNVKQERFKTGASALSNGKVHKCPDCVYIGRRKETLQRHIKAIHQKVKPFSCSYCQYETSYNYHLSTHHERHHPGKQLC